MIFLLIIFYVILIHNFYSFSFLGFTHIYRYRGEKKIAEYLMKKNISFQFQKKFNDCRNIRPLSYDFYVIFNNTKYLIEYNGIQHYKPINFFGGITKFEKQQLHDNIKLNYSKNNSYKLITIIYNQTDINKFLDDNLI
jgi:hypothetical protein